MKSNLSLIEYLADELKLNYISDLRNERSGKDELASIIEKIDIDQFVVSEWSKAIHYIFNVKEVYGSVKDAKEAFLSKLPQPAGI